MTKKNTIIIYILSSHRNLAHERITTTRKYPWTNKESNKLILFYLNYNDEITLK